MGKTVYLDCFSGASGDMVLGALLDLGLPVRELQEALGSLALDLGGIRAERVLRAGVSATKFRHGSEDTGDRSTPRDHHHHHPDRGRGVPQRDRPEPQVEHTHHHVGHDHHSLSDIEQAIGRSALSAGGKARAVSMFRRLAEAEAAIHEMPVERIHLHEVGALDSIVDIVGAVFGMEWLKGDEVVASPLNVGSGTVQCAHGMLPVPAPATARLLTGIPVYSGSVPAELVTPTGALIVTEYASRYGVLPPMRIDAIGYGAGDRDTPGQPNVLRVMVGETARARSVERVLVLESEIDDMNPQLFGPLMERLHAEGALDVFYVPVLMKKNRPGTLVTVLVAPERREAITALLFAETTTIGVRCTEVQRERLDREVRSIQTPAGAIRFKIARRDGRVVNVAPEFEDCARIAAERGLPIKDVQAMATKAWLDSRTD